MLFINDLIVKKNNGKHKISLKFALKLLILILKYFITAAAETMATLLCKH